MPNVEVINDSHQYYSNCDTLLCEEVKLNSYPNNVLFDVVEQRQGTEELRKKLHKIPPILRKIAVNEVKEKTTLFQKAVITKQKEVMELLVDYEADIYAIPEGGYSSLYLSINDEEIFQYLFSIIKKDRKENIPIQFGKIIFYLIREKKGELLKIILEKGSPFIDFINLGMGLNTTPIHCAIVEKNFDALKILIEAGADLLDRNNKNLSYPFHSASAAGNIQCFDYYMQALIKYIDNKLLNREYICLENLLFSKSKDGSDVLHFASYHGNYQIIEKLLRISIKWINERSSLGMTATHYAVSSGNALCLSHLLSRKPNIFIEDKNGNTPIVYAGYKNHYHCGIQLLNYINQFQYELSFGEVKRNVLLDKRIFLVQSVIDTSNIIEVSVNRNLETFEDLMINIGKIKNSMFSRAKFVQSKAANEIISWKKFPLLHLKYERDKEVSKGGAVVRDFLSIASKIILQNNRIFYSSDKGRSYRLLYQEEIDEDLLEHMRLIGFFIALCVITNPVHFPLAKFIFQFIADEKIEEKDVLGDQFVTQFNLISSLSPQEKEDLCIPFEARFNTAKGSIIDVPFSENVNEIVNEENFGKYRGRLLFEHLFGGCRKEMLNALALGFYSLIPKCFLKVTSDNYRFYHANIISSVEIIQLISKVKVDKEEWKEFTSYTNCNSTTDQVIWFWEYINNSSSHVIKMVLEFVTGSAMLPVGGFKFLASERVPFTIEILNEEKYRLPSVRACMYTLILPLYPDKESLFNAMNFAITNCDGFQFV